MNASDMLRQLNTAHPKTYSTLLKVGADHPDCGVNLHEIFGISQVQPLSLPAAAQAAATGQSYDLLQLNINQHALPFLADWLDETTSYCDLLLCGTDEDTLARSGYLLGQKGYRCLCQSGDGQTALFSVLPDGCQHIVMTATADNFHFAEPLIGLARQEGHLVSKLSLRGLTKEGLQGWLRHCDVAWFEWGDSTVIAASHLPKQCRMVCRIHRYELYDDAFLQTNWGNIDEVIFVSQAMKALFVKRLGDKLPKNLTLSVIPNLTAHRPASVPAAARHNPFRIGCVARFVGCKNLFLLIPIMQQLIQHDERYRLFIAGRVEDRCLYDAFTETIERMGLTPWIHIEGALAADKMAHWYSDKALLLSTSYSESQGMGIFEAMLAGVKPVAFPASGGLEEYLPAAYQFRTIDEAVAQLTAPLEPREYYINQAIRLLDQENVARACAQRWAKPVAQRHFTIVIPVYNRENFIISAVSSALSQDYPLFDVVVVDDGSTDNTLASLRTSFNDPRLTIIDKPHTNAPDTRNTGIQHAKGEYLVWLDSDDLLHRQALSHYSELLERWPQSDIISCSLTLFGNGETQFFPSPPLSAPASYLDKIAMGNVINNPGCCVRKQLYLDTGGYDITFLRAHDYEFWTRAAAGGKLLHAPHNNIQYRQHDANLTGTKWNVDRSYEYRLFSRLTARYPLKSLFPQLSRAQAEKYVALRKTQLEHESGVDNLAIVIPAWGDGLAALDSAFLSLAQQRDRAFQIWVAAEHDLSFLSVPTVRQAQRDIPSLLRHITAQDSEHYWHIYELRTDVELSSEAISQLKSHILNREGPEPAAFVNLRTGQAH